MSLTAIIFLIILGVILFYVEFLIIPGVTIAGIAGVICIIVGVYFGYKEYGSPVGHYILLSTAIVSILSIFFMLRSDTWKKIGLNTKIDSKVSSSLENEVPVGVEGETVTRLNPYGKVQIADKLYEAKSSDAFIDPKSKIQVKKVEGSQIIVKPLN
jgi:membrane-bound ClpP family serine protease